METLRRKNEGWTTYQTLKIPEITVTPSQLLKQYPESGKIPGLISPGRPAKPGKKNNKNPGNYLSPCGCLFCCWRHSLQAASRVPCPKLLLQGPERTFRRLVL